MSTDSWSTDLPTKTFLLAAEEGRGGLERIILRRTLKKIFLPFDSIFWSSTFWFSFFRVLASDYVTSFLSQSCLRWIFHINFRALKSVFTDSGKSCHLYHFRAQWIVVWSVSLSSFWPGAFASIDICRLLTGLFGYCVYSLLADHIDRWLPKSFTEKWGYETYLACNCGTYLKRRYEILWRPFLTLSSLEVKAGLAF